MASQKRNLELMVSTCCDMGDSSMKTGDVKTGNIKSSLEVLCSGISVVLSKHLDVLSIAEVSPSREC